MPEGDTVLRTARRLDAALRGDLITDAELRWPSLAEARLRGRHTVEVVSRGKHLLHRFDDGRTLHSHLRMEGQWRIEATSAPGAWGVGNQVRAVIGTSTWTALGLRLGMLDLVATRDEHLLVGHLGPDLLGADWDLDRAVAAVSTAAGTIAQALLDQRNLAGIGTLYAAEALFREGVSPWAPAARLGPETVSAVVSRARDFLLANVGRATQSTTGDLTRGRTTAVHGRQGLACRRCGGPVRTAPTGDGSVDRVLFYCPTCQGGVGPTDHGRPQAPLGASLTPQRLRPRRGTAG